MAKSQRDKGLRGENEVVNLIKEVIPDARRNLGESGSQLVGVDVLAGSLRMQVKRWKDYAPISKLDEVPNGVDTIRALVTRGDRQSWVIALELTDFLRVCDDVTVVYDGVDPNVPPF